MIIQRKRRLSRLLAGLLALLALWTALPACGALASTEAEAPVYETPEASAPAEEPAPAEAPAYEPAEEPAPGTAGQAGEMAFQSDGAGAGYDFPRDSSGNRYYIAPGSASRWTGWLEMTNGDWYLFDSAGRMVTGWFKSGGGYWYYFDPDTGIMHTGWLKDGGATYYLWDSGHMATGWLQMTNGDWYYFSSNGKMARGWLKYNGYWYYLDPDTGIMRTGWLEDGGETYYLWKTGHMATGWLQMTNGDWYFFNSNGKMARGWYKSSGGYWYFLDEDTGVMQTGWLTRGQNVYYLWDSGKMATGWLKMTNGDWYYFGNDGIMRTGWQVVNGLKYYFYKEGDGLGGTPGVNASDITVDDYYVNSKGYTTSTWDAWQTMLTMCNDKSSETDYIIMVDRANCVIGVFQGSRGNWENVLYAYCTPGKASTPTPEGTYRINYFQRYYDDGSYRVYYVAGFRAGGYCLHSILYNSGGGSLQDSRVGQRLSHGCIRLNTDDAYYIYQNCPVGTAVVIY